jgi:hypothetical protein
MVQAAAEVTSTASRLRAEPHSQRAGDTGDIDTELSKIKFNGAHFPRSFACWKTIAPVTQLFAWEPGKPRVSGTRNEGS